MTPVFLDVTDFLNKFLSGAEGDIAGALSNVTGAAQELGSTFMMIGILVTVFFSIVPLFNGQPINIDPLIKVAVMVGLFASYKPLIMAVDSMVKKPGESIEAMSNSEGNNGEIALQKYEQAYKQALDEQYIKETEDNTGMFSDLEDGMDYMKTMFTIENIKTIIWIFLSTIINIIFMVVLFLIKAASIYGTQILIALGPISMGISFIRGFEGSITTLVKQIIVFRLWVLVGCSIKYAGTKIGFMDPIIEATARLAATSDGSLVAPDYGPLVIQAVFIVIMLMTPMYADSLISGSQGGAFFSAAMSKGSALGNQVLQKSGANSVIKGAKQRAGNVAKSANNAANKGMGSLGRGIGRTGANAVQGATNMVKSGVNKLRNGQKTS